MGSVDYPEGPANKSAEAGREDVIVISDREEGEIVDASDLDDISDISTDEEILLRERIQVLENYNNALERKEAKKRLETRKLDASHGTLQPTSLHLISNQIAQNGQAVQRNLKTPHPLPVKRAQRAKTSRYSSRKYEIAKKCRTYPKLTIIHSTSPIKTKDNREKHKATRKHKIIISSSDSSDEDFSLRRDKRQKLQEAIRISSKKNDKSSLKLRLYNMMHNSNRTNTIESTTIAVDELVNDKVEDLNAKTQIDSNDDSVADIGTNVSGSQCVETHEITALQEEEKTICKDDETMSEDDLESLRQLALKTKVKKKDEVDNVEIIKGNVISTHTTDTLEKNDDHNNSDDKKENTSVASLGSAEDSDTADLRLICLKSAVLKKAMERKRKQKEHRRRTTTNEKKDRSISTSSLRQLAKICDENNHTDVESVDMEIGASDVETMFNADDGTVDPMTEKQIELRKLDETLYSESRPYCTYKLTSLLNRDDSDIKENLLNNVDVLPPPVEDLDEDEDILRAKLLTSLTSQNIQKMSTNKSAEHVDVLKENKQIMTSNIVINLRESSDESDNENIKNLTKMHEKLKQTEFEQSLDLFLKNARKQAETGTLQAKDIVHTENIPPAAKQTIKAVNHLPKSNQLEYKRLVKRMAELERVKQSRQTSLRKALESGKLKDCMKIKILQSCNDRTVIAESKTNQEVAVLQKVKTSEVQPEKKMPLPKIDIRDDKIYDRNSTESAITISRRRIANEASTVMRLRAEATALGARTRAAAAELRHARTAVTINRRALRVAQQSLTAARDQHNCLLRSSINQSTKYVNSKLTNPHTLSSQRTVLVQPEIKLSDSIENIVEVENISVTNRKLSISLDLNKDTKTIGYVQKVIPKPETTRKVEIIPTKTSNELQKNTNVTNVSVTIPQTIRSEFTNQEVKKTQGKSSMSKSEVVSKVVSDSTLSKSNKVIEATKRLEAVKDYTSPLEAIHSNNSWCDALNAVFCPFEVEGTCKDADCKYVHPKNT